MKEPRISVCIPTYNRADLLVDTLNCIAYQTVRPYEVIVLDNASTDNTQELVKQYKHLHINYIRHETNIGMAQNYNACVREATTEYLTFLPSDDVIAPDWYETWIKTINKHPADLYLSPLTVVDNELRILWSLPLFTHDKLIKQPHVAATFHDHMTPGVPPTALCIFKKELLQKFGPFDPDHGTEFDVKVMLQLFDEGTVFYLHRFLYALREHPYRAFEHEKQTKEKQFLTRLERNFMIISDLWNNKYKKNVKKRHFLHCCIFMNLCNINLYIARGEWHTIIKSYQLAHRFFPDLFTYRTDWYAYARYQTEFIRRIFTLRYVPASIKTETAWIKKIRAV